MSLGTYSRIPLRGTIVRNELETRCYIDGVDVGDVEPKLTFLEQDDWMTPFLSWISLHHFGRPIYAVRDREERDAAWIVSIHVGEPPDVLDEGQVLEEFHFSLNPELN